MISIPTLCPNAGKKQTSSGTGRAGGCSEEGPSPMPHLRRVQVLSIGAQGSRSASFSKTCNAKPIWNFYVKVLNFLNVHHKFRSKTFCNSFISQTTTQQNSVRWASIFFFTLQMQQVNWLIRLYRFQVCHATIHHLYSTLCKIYHNRTGRLLQVCVCRGNTHVLLHVLYHLLCNN